MSEYDVEPLEDLIAKDLPLEPTEEVPVIPSKANRHEEACFPSNDYGMPLALLSIPTRERAWFWHDAKYRGMEIAHVKAQASEHEYLFKQEEDRAFYVKSPKGTIGLVPFPNSTIVWPHELAWEQDLAPENKGKKRPDLKPSEQKKKR